MSNCPFKVIDENEHYVFISAELFEIEKLSKEFVNYFFSEENTFAYFKSLECNSVFKPTKANYAYLYNVLAKFYDTDKDNPRNDKIGKIGEYFLSILLLNYFNYDCVYPKLLAITSNNMSVFGIDTLFYSPLADLMMFGEAKLTDTLTDGITQVEDSLNEYEAKLKSEFLFMTSNLPASTSNQKIIDIFKKGNTAISMEEFLKMAGFNMIGVPLFVCHGEETDESEILSKLKGIKLLKAILGFKVKYVCISLPINNKKLFVDSFIKVIKEKAEEYGRLRK